MAACLYEGSFRKINLEKIKYEKGNEDAEGNKCEQRTKESKERKGNEFCSLKRIV